MMVWTQYVGLVEKLTDLAIKRECRFTLTAEVVLDPNSLPEPVTLVIAPEHEAGMNGHSA